MMDYESEQLDKYDSAEAQRFILGAIKKPDPSFSLFGVESDKLAKAGKEVKEDFNNVVVGAARDLGQGLIDYGADFIEAGGEQFLKESGLVRKGGDPIRLSIPRPRLPEVEEPATFVGQLARDFVQFGGGMLVAPNKGMVVRSAFSDSYFDPQEGGFIRPLIDLEILPEAMDFLAVDVDEESTAEERLKGRLQLAGQGTLAGAAVDGIIATLKAIKNSPAGLKRAGATLAAALGMSLPATDAEAAPPIKTLLKRLTKPEAEAIERTATKDGVLDKKLAKQVTDEALRIKNTYPVSDGWLPININPGGTAPTFKVTDKGEIKIKWQEPSYQFHLPPGYVGTKNKPKPEELAVHKDNLASRMVDDVQAVVDRALAGDEAAKEIIGQANWYRSMRTRLRKEFGGLGDVFADVIGATSAQTGVQQNYDNALIVLRRFVRGEFDEEIAMYEKMVASGEPLNQKALTRLHKDPDSPFKLITKASGALFNTNSAAATGALLDMFRQIKVGQAPKTINFTGNLIGYGNQATVDVWAARYLRDAAGLPRIPPPVEKAVAGQHLTGSTMDNPRIGGEFGFGQEVFEEAAKRINASQMITEVDSSLGALGADDLQAVIWFLEKEKWTKNGWTSKAGEGGSLDYESDFGGSPDRDRVAALRSRINEKFSPPPKRKAETDDEYAVRLQEAQSADAAEREAAREELAGLRGEPERFVAGVSRERPNQRPTNVEQAELASELTAPLQADDTVIGFQANNTYGEFMGDSERALNFEVTTQTNFNPEAMTKALVEAGRKYDQDAVFISKVVPDNTPGARPGVEVYFRDRQGADYAQQITALLREKGIDGFTFITDARQMDRVDVQAAGTEDIAGLVGIRFQYIPEFDDAFDPARAEDIFKEKSDIFRDIMDEVGDIDGITYADVVFYDTKVFKNTDRSGTEWINGGTSYEQQLGSAAGESAGARQDGDQLFSEAAP
jgi:hypothetical protein